MRFAVETWAPEYGVAADAAELEPTAGDVDVTVERKAEEWAPIVPGDVPAPESMIFVDGVRRFDARIWIGGDDGEVVRPGVCASVAAGVVRCVGDSAEVVAAEVRRGVFATAGNGAAPIGTEHGRYELYPVADDSSEGLYLGVHEQMTALETELTDTDVDLAVFDGPLRGRNHPNGVGYVKTQHVQYLPDEQQPTVYALDPGRTHAGLPDLGEGLHPVVVVRAAARPEGAPAVRDRPLRAARHRHRRAGRAPGRPGDRAPPRFASEPHKDPRAPQNLYPIAGLERDLRRRLGDQQLLERALRIAAVG